MHPSHFAFPFDGKRQKVYRGDNIERIEPSARGPPLPPHSYEMKRARRSHDRTVAAQQDENPAGIQEPLENDVCLGRGGTANKHTGNEKLRQFARLQSENYRSSSKKGKSAISRLIVKQMRDLRPPARFIKKDSLSGLWEEVGEDTAREKASQVLRDAVATLPPSDVATEGQGVESIPYPVSAQDPSSFHEITPALQSVASTPHTSSSRRKRRRYSNSRREVASAPADSYEQHPATLSYSPVVRHHNSEHLPRYHSLRSRSREPPYSPGRRAVRSLYAYPRTEPTPGYLHPGHPEVQQPVFPEPQHSAGDADFMGSGAPHISELDLFRGELLASDVEDEAETLSHGPTAGGDIF